MEMIQLLLSTAQCQSLSLAFLLLFLAVDLHIWRGRFLLVTDAEVYVTPFNFSEINTHVVAGPALYIAG